MLRHYVNCARLHRAIQRSGVQGLPETGSELDLTCAQYCTIPSKDNTLLYLFHESIFATAVLISFTGAVQNVRFSSSIFWSRYLLSVCVFVLVSVFFWGGAFTFLVVLSLAASRGGRVGLARYIADGDRRGDRVDTVFLGPGEKLYI